MRKAGLWCAASLLVLTVAVLATSKIIHSAWNHERCAASITGWASDNRLGDGPSHRAFTFGRVDYPWLPAVRSLFWGRPVQFDAWDITIWDPDGKEVLHAPHVQAGLRLDRLVWPLLGGLLPWRHGDIELHFVEANVDTIRCRIDTTRAGAVNLVAAFASRVATPPSGDGLIVSVQGSSVGDGSFRMTFPGWGGAIGRMQVRLDRLRYSSFASEQQPERPAFTYHVSRVLADRGEVVIGDRSFPLDHLVVTEFAAEEPARQDIVIRSVARSLGAGLSASGRLTDLYSDHAGVDLRMAADHGRNLIARFPAAAMITGDPSATAHLSGPFASVVIEGAARRAGLAVAGIEATRVAADYRYSGGTLRLREITSDVADGHVNGDVTLELMARTWRADLRLVDLDSIWYGRLLPIGLLAYTAGRFQRLARGDSGPDQTLRLRLAGVDATLYRRPVDKLPHRVVLRGGW